MATKLGEIKCLDDLPWEPRNKDDKRPYWNKWEHTMSDGRIFYLERQIAEPHKLFAALGKDHPLANWKGAQHKWEDADPFAIHCVLMAVLDETI